VTQDFGRVGMSVALLTLASCISQLALAQQTGLEKTTVAYRKVDGHEILADVYRPKGSSVCPVIVYIHGGELIEGNREAVKYDARVLSLAEQKGYAVVSID